MRSSRASSPSTASAAKGRADGTTLAVVAHGLADERDLALVEPGQAGVEDEVARVLVVVVVVDRHADVVERAGGPQQLALGRVAIVEARPRRGRRRGRRASRVTCATCCAPGRRTARRGSRRSRGGRRRTAAARRGRAALEEHALAQARLGRLERLEPADVEHGCTTTAPARMRSARAGLIPGRAALRGGRSARRSTSSSSASRRDAEALDAEPRQPGRALGGGGQGADGAAEADEPAAAAGQPRRERARRRTCARSARSCLPLAGSSPGRKRSVIRTAPSGQDPARPPGARDADELERPAAEVEHGAVGERRRVDRREVAVAGLLLAATARGSAGPVRARRGEEVLGVLRVADRARRDGVDRVASRPAARRSARRPRSWPGRGPCGSSPSAPSRRGPRRCGPARRPRRCASTTRPPRGRPRVGTSSTRGRRRRGGGAPTGDPTGGPGWPRPRGGSPEARACRRSASASVAAAAAGGCPAACARSSVKYRKYADWVKIVGPSVPIGTWPAPGSTSGTLVTPAL